MVRCPTPVVTRSHLVSERPALFAPVGAIIVAALSCALAVPSIARAHALVDEGRRLYEEAEFVEALDVLGRAASGDDLTLPELVELLELRALVHSAVGDEPAVREDLRTLAAVAPEHTLPRGMPPDVQRMFTEIRASATGSPRLIATPSVAGPATGNGVIVEVQVENDWASVVRAVRIRGRAEGGSYAEAVDAPLFVAAPLGAVISYYAEAIGPGGAVIATAGSEAAPLSYAGAEARSGEGGGLDPWPFVIAGGAALVLGAVIAIVAVAATSTPSNTTQVEPFVVRF